jgi:ribose/xylose/arabinose/galactoside ABC-type transport system permease subunit
MKKTSLLSPIRESRLFWPLVAWVLILVFDAIVEPGFFKLGIIDDPVYGKHLYGNLVDIFNNGAPLMLTAIGMTL